MQLTAFQGVYRPL